MFWKVQRVHILLPIYTVRVDEPRNDKSLENDVISGSGQPWNLVLDKDHDTDSTIASGSKLVIPYGAYPDWMDVEQRIVEASYPTHDVIVNPFEQLPSQEVVSIEQQAL